MKNDLLNNLRIASPCSVSWESMSGNERVRHCGQCDLHVFDFSELTSAEAIALISSTQGRICARLHRRVDGTVITRDCPVGLRALRQRVARRAGIVFATVLGLSATLFAQSGSRKPDTMSRESVGVQKGQSKEPQAIIVGTVTDKSGALIADASVELTEDTRHVRLLTATNDLGQYRFDTLKPGKYSVLITTTFFKKLLITEIMLGTNEALRLNSALEVKTEETVGMLVTAEAELTTENTPLITDPPRKRPR